MVGTHQVVAWLQYRAVMAFTSIAENLNNQDTINIRNYCLLMHETNM